MNDVIGAPSEIELPTRRATRQLGRALARALQPGDAVILSGALGAGKTFLVRAVCRAMGLEAGVRVVSPTFTLIRELDTVPRVAHADLYRLTSPEEAHELGLAELRERGLVLLVEWGAPHAETLGPDRLTLALELAPRRARLAADGPRSEVLRQSVLAAMAPPPSSSRPERPRYIGPPTPVVFPEEAEVPETQVHFELRVLLYQLLCDHLGLDAIVGSDQFVYYDAGDPSRCLAPDVYVQLKAPAGKIRSWKTWERGAPDVAVEIVSPSDAPQLPWSDELRRYQSMGVRELVRFDAEARPGEPVLRIWDRVEGGLLERDLGAGPCLSCVMDVRWVVARADDHARALRVTQSSDSDALVPTRKEARQAEAQARQAEAQARQAAEQRVRELEAELRRRS